MKNTIGKRLEEIMLDKGYNKNSLAREAKMHPTTLKNWIDDKTKPDDLKLDILLKILKANRDYIFTGNGDKYNLKENETVEYKKIGVPYVELPIDSKLNLLYDLVISQNKKIDDLARENAELKEQNEDIKERIKDNLFVLQSEIEAIMDEFNVQLDDKIKKDINKIVEQN
ncbi:hypothetical protein ATE47_03945 [Chryseobacterium sp. IHB B 17019]|uniref:helix-turn-helix domain-containing protein n=1 Tax=Chryseobacterium sp. IHB B 17019 TaxID=1721091 RepID=UPI0007204F1D|nr:helix-turn-helix domain-containing protein [Chryseobacterium sp. IHB B 17019]ALR29723.1 hypothetical protein ATE47_03945 [Chryseobacterium sp. IHB B 17019]